jgi:uncharacterized membrane protein
MLLLRRALVDGALVVLPVGAIILLVLGIITKLREAADPLSGTFFHPVVVAVVLFVLLCLVVGIFVRSRAGRHARLALEATLFEKLPGYRLVKAFAGRGPMAGEGRAAMRPALAAIEDGLCPALVMDSFADGRLLVFVPGSPAPMSGSLYVFSQERVTLLDVPLLPFMKAISSWGLGLREMVEAEEAQRIAS